MACYVDTSVVLRNVFEEGEPIEFWKDFGVPYASELLRVEAFRALHRRRLCRELTDGQLADALDVLHALLDHVGELLLDRLVLTRAAAAFPCHVRTLDALHLATAALWREQGEPVEAFLTHDERQAIAARSLGFRTLGA